MGASPRRSAGCGKEYAHVLRCAAGAALACIASGPVTARSLKTGSALFTGDDRVYINGALDENFSKARKLFEFVIDPYGRQPQDPQGAILDFELEYGFLKPNADILLDSMYWSFGGGSCLFGADRPVWEDPNRWWSIGTDGGSRYRQAPGELIHLELTSSSFQTPEVILGSDMLPALDEYIFLSCQSKLPLPGSDGKISMVPGRHWEAYTIQYTVGLPMEQMYTLMRYSAGQAMWNRTEAQCVGKPTLYKVVVALAAMTAKGVTETKAEGTCQHAKYYVSSWLVRTHHGDMAAYAKSIIGDWAFSRFKEDVLKVSGAGPIPFLHGVIDYLHLPEIAEVSGLVKPRNGLNLERSDPEVHDNSSEKAAYMRPSPSREHTHFPLHHEALSAMPSTRQGVCELAQRVLNQTGLVTKALNKLGCGVYFPDGSVRALQVATTSEWLDGILEGKDLWTDPENPFVQASSSKLVFKSMGRWHMRAGYVYLECRNSGGYDCLDAQRPNVFWFHPNFTAKITKTAQDLQAIMRKIEVSA